MIGLHRGKEQNIKKREVELRGEVESKEEQKRIFYFCFFMIIAMKVIFPKLRASKTHKET